MKRLVLYTLLVSLVFSACGQTGARREKVFDFINNLDLADHAVAQGCRLDSKTLDSPFVSRSGWKHTWATKRRALVNFPLLEVEPCQLQLSLYPVVFPDMPSQHLKILLNGREIGEYDFAYEQFKPELHNEFFGMAKQEIPIDATLLLRGSNALELKWAYIYNPAEVVSRNTIHTPSAAAVSLLAVIPRGGGVPYTPATADRVIRTESLRTGQEVTEVIRQPVPSDLHYYLRVPPNSVLHYRFHLTAADTDPREGLLHVGISLQKDIGSEEVQIATHQLRPAKTRKKSIRGKIRLKKWASDEIVRLSFSARGDQGTLLDTGHSLYWTDLWLASPTPGAADKKTEAARTSAKTSPETPPNVVIFLIDTLRRDFVGAFDSQQLWTPDFDRLAEDGVTFDRAYSVTSWTLPAVASLLTGQDPYVHEAIFHAEQMAAEGRRIPDELITLYEAVKALDYRTLLYTANGMIRADLGFDQGVDEYDARSSEYTLYPAAKFATWLSNSSDPRPFFAYLHNLDPHSPYTKWDSLYEGAPELEREAKLNGDQETLDQLRHGQIPFTEVDAEYIKSLYLSEVKLSDFRLGQVIQALKDKGLYESCLIVALADHGEEFLDHDSWQHGDSLYQEQVHIPLVVKFPGNLFAGQHYDGQAGILDIYPTVLDVIGLEPSQPMPGRSLLRLLREKERGPGGTEHYSSLRFNNRDWFSVVNGRWKLILRGRAILGLFDLETDPRETRSVVLDRPILAGYYRQRILQWQRSQALLRQHLVSSVPEAVPISEEDLEQLRAMGYLND